MKNEYVESMKARDIAFGRHSQIPECCIRFFVDKWDCMRDTPHARKVRKLNWDYVPCPKCLAANRRATIRLCQVECRRECWRYF